MASLIEVINNYLEQYEREVNEDELDAVPLCYSMFEDYDVVVGEQWYADIPNLRIYLDLFGDIDEPVAIEHKFQTAEEMAEFIKGYGEDYYIADADMYIIDKVC